MHRECRYSLKLFSRDRARRSRPALIKVFFRTFRSLYWTRRSIKALNVSRLLLASALALRYQDAAPGYRDVRRRFVYSQIVTHSGEETVAPYRSVTFIDTGFPQTFFRRDVLDRMLWVGGASAARQLLSSPRSWDAFDEFVFYRT